MNDHLHRSSRPGVDRCLAVAAALTAVLFAGAASAADDVWSIERLNGEKERWGDWLDKPLKVEGRVSAVSRYQFRFVHCDLTFHVSEDQSRTIGNVRNVEVSGRIKKEKETGKLVFAVDRVRTLPSDVEQFDSREARLKSTHPTDWYELAEWARARGRFYGDDELAGRARRAWLKGARLERQSLPEGDAEARFSLAKRLGELQLDDGLQEELIHEGARLKWEVAKGNTDERTRFAAWLAKTYPSGAAPLENLPAELSRRYEAQPLETFHAADEATRDVLKRLFFIQMELARILPLAKEDGSNAGAIADALAERVPERKDLIHQYRELAFTWRMKSVASASRQEAVRLAEELRTRDQAAAADELLRTWIRSREDRLRKDGPIGLLQLAEDYLQLLRDEPTAVMLLAEAHALDPSFSDPCERLRQLGYRLHHDRWMKGEGPEALTPGGPKGHSELALGMPAEDVLALLGTPTAKSRMITSAGVREVWSFGPRGTPRLVIHLQRSAASATLRVTRFLTEN